VADRQFPIINGFPGSPAATYTYSLNTGLNSATATLVLPNITATDNVQLSSAGFLPSSYVVNTQYTFAVGSTVLVFSAVDTSLNQASVTLTIVVTDVQKPNFFGCPPVAAFNASVNASIVVNTTEGDPTAPVSWNSITATDNVDGNRVLITQDSILAGYTDGSLFPVGLTWIIYTAADVAGNSRECYFSVVVKDYELPTIICPETGATHITNSPSDTVTVVSWRYPVVTDNHEIAEIRSNFEPGVNFTIGIHNVTYFAWDVSGNNVSCTFSFTVEAMKVETGASSASSSTATSAAAAAAGGVLFLLLLLVVIIVVMRRRTKKKLQAATSGYAELMAMSDEFIIERARAIQQALVEQRQSSPPASVTSQAIHPERKFSAPPTTLAELEEYMRSTVLKEIPRSSLEFGAELGSGEFGAVCEGFYLRPPVEKLKVAIKTLRKATSDDDKVRFLKEAAIMAQFNHPNIVSLTGVCTLPPTEPTLIVLEYMHLGSLHGYLQSPMVYDQLECLTMVRMALDVGAGMQYLAEAGFVHRDLAARNVLLDKTMTCRVGDFGLSVDLAAEDKEDTGVYSGTEGAKIPVRWTAIEAVCFRQFSTASDVWSFGILLWEIWSYAEMPYKGWNNKKVTEQVGNGYRLLKPANCPDEVYKVMIECWNKNVKRRITFPKINEALIEIWKDIARGGDQDDDNNAQDADEGEGGMYDNTTTRMELSDSEDEEPVKVPVQEDDEGRDDVAVDVPKFGGSMDAPAVPDESVDEPAPPSPAPVFTTAPTPAPEPAVVAAIPTPTANTGKRSGISESDVGKRVTVTNFGEGVLRFFGPHHRDGKPRCGVELNSAIGINNGTVGDFKYFECEAKRGVLVDPRVVTVADSGPAPLMLNPIYDSTPSQPVPTPGGYLSISADD